MTGASPLRACTTCSKSSWVRFPPCADPCHEEVAVYLRDVRERMNRTFGPDDVGKSFVCVRPKLDGDQYLWPGEALVEGRVYKLARLNRDQGIFEGTTCWGAPVSYTAGMFDPVTP